MLQRDFEKLKIIDLVKDSNNDLYIGDYFLTSTLEQQKLTKSMGDEVVVYVVTEKKGNNITYMQKFLRLE
jgi:hypothetical protein